MTTTPTAGTHAKPAPLGASAGRWTGGFWGDVLDRTRAVTVPSIWESLSDSAVSPAWRNFLTAAGRVDGEHAGPPFLDGDLYKWLESAISVLETGWDAELAATVDEVVSTVASVQRDDGYVHTPTLIAARNHQQVDALADRFHFETYNLGHLITAGVRHAQVTGSPALLDVGRKATAFLAELVEHHPDQLARNAICPSHYMAVVDLYRETGDQQYLRLAQALLAVRDEFRGGDDNQDRVPVREQRVVAGHAVRANYLYAGLADLVAETGDAELADVLTRLWHDVVSTKLYVTGGCGALYDGASPDGYPKQQEISRVHQAYGRAYQLPHTTAHNESCANIGMILWSERMLALTGEAAYADVIEQIAYNSLLASISLDGRRFSYTNPLRQVRDLPYPLRMPGETAERPVPDPPASHARLRTEYLSVFCCPPNIARTLARLHERAASVSDDGLWIHLYGDADVDAATDDGRRLHLIESSGQPWDEHVAFTVAGTSGGGMPLRLRIPAWARGATLAVGNGAPEPVQLGSYAVIDRVWHAGDTVALTLPVPVRLQRAHRLAEESANQVAVTRGALVYCLESHDLPEDVRLEQVALRRGVEFAPVESEIDGHRVVGLEGEAVVLPLTDDDHLYTDVEEAPLRTTRIRLIPYFSWGNRGPGEMSVWLPVVW